jgi:hypothetical protein
MGRCLAPCDGRTTTERYALVVGEMLEALASPGTLLRGLEVRMLALAEQERFEEAALARDRLRALAEALHRARVDRWLTRGVLVLGGPRGERLELRRGALVAAPSWPAAEPIGSPAPRERADELSVVRGWLRRHPARVLACDAPPAEPVDGGRELARLLASIRASDEPGRGRRVGRASGRATGRR